MDDATEANFHTAVAVQMAREDIWGTVVGGVQKILYPKQGGSQADECQW